MQELLVDELIAERWNPSQPVCRGRRNLPHLQPRPLSPQDRHAPGLAEAEWEEEDDDEDGADDFEEEGNEEEINLKETLHRMSISGAAPPITVTVESTHTY